MNERKTAQILEECLQRMQMGERPESILRDYPQQAGELRPLLESAQQAQGGVLHLPPVSGVSRSRAQFLEAAAAQTQRRRWFAFSLPRFGSALLTTFILILTIGLVVALASDRSLPGQPLYGIKRSVERAQLALSGDALTHLSREDAFDQRRAEEVRQLILSGRQQAVEFSGLLTRRIEDGYNQWSAAGIDFTLSGALQSSAGSMAGAYVELRGFVRGQQGVEITEMQLRLYQIGGILQSKTDEEWIIEGVRVRLPSLAELIGTPEVGKPISVTAIRVGENDFLALSARAGRLNPPQTPTFTPNQMTPTLTLTRPASTATLAPLPSATPRPQISATPAADSGSPTDDDSGRPTDEPGSPTDDSDDDDDDDDNSGKGGGGDDDGSD